jgi:hypothetical protein
MVTFTVSIEEQKPGVLILDFVPSDPAQGSAREVMAGEIVCRAISFALDEVMKSGAQGQSFVGDFVTDEWKENLLRSLKAL